ncbi:adenosylcobinamide-GDP ribazoletransferase [Maritalea mobilis]|uniref:adenosylcobinamide-GDP ribazoletransferase n=1 Tax=Maritalea mobilis TaxID=483324 RepID=UPI001FE47A74|nr:adenosylcobinamide-GDP ribazoletransferase [Maritalea mobilis]
MPPPSVSPINDNEAGAPPPEKLSPVDAIIMGVRFYSRLPTGDSPHLPLNFGKMIHFLPVASLLIGVFPALTILLLGAFGVQSLFVATVAIAMSAVITGAMAEDAFGDAMDGLFGGHDVARRLEIMKDSRHGTYGVLGLIAPFMLRVITLGTLIALSPVAASILWLVSALLARQAAPIVAVMLPPARSDGASAGAGILAQKDFAIGLVPALALFCFMALLFAGPIALFLALIFGVGLCFFWLKLLTRLLGGQTGDTIGALQLVLEIAALSAFILL